jgi:hypothetical protein
MLSDCTSKKSSRLEELRRRLPTNAVSTTTLEGEGWLRSVAANPNADADALTNMIRSALEPAG